MGPSISPVPVLVCHCPGPHYSRPALQGGCGGFGLQQSCLFFSSGHIWPPCRVIRSICLSSLWDVVGSSWLFLCHVAAHACGRCQGMHAWGQDHEQLHACLHAGSGGPSSGPASPGGCPQGHVVHVLSPREGGPQPDPAGTKRPV